MTLRGSPLHARMVESTHPMPSWSGSIRLGLVRWLGVLAFGTLASLGGCSQADDPDAKDATEPELRSPATSDVAGAASPTSRARDSALPTIRSSPDADRRQLGVNPTIDTEEDAVSAFALDVDTASYTLTRSLLSRDELPDPEAVRVEEFINYFEYDYPEPRKAEDFAVQAVVVPSPTRPGYHLLHLGLQTRAVQLRDRAPANLVFLIDGSSSMGRDDRLALVKDGLRRLNEVLDHRDRVAIVSYGGRAEIVLPPTPGDRKQLISAAIDRLEPVGVTNLAAGLDQAFDLLAQSGPIGRVVVCSDGVANTGTTDAAKLLEIVDDRTAPGVTLSSVGVGMGYYNDALLEELADQGGGNYAYVDRREEAERVFVENLTGQLQRVAMDARVQVAFEASAVARYRLIGYDNRTLPREEDDAFDTDGGDIGAGHSVTALYEIELRPTELDTLATVYLRYHRPDGKLLRFQHRIAADTIVESLALPPSTALAIVAASFAEKLRGSYWVHDLQWPEIERLHAQLSPGLLRRAEVTELGLLITAAARLAPTTPTASSDVSPRFDFARVPILK